MEMIVLVREDCVNEDFLGLLGSSVTHYDAQVVLVRISTGEASDHTWRVVTPRLPEEERLNMLVGAAVEKLRQGGGEWMLELSEKLMTLPELYALATELHLSVDLVAVIRSPDHKSASAQ